MPRGGIPAALARYLSTIGKPPTKTGIEPNLNIKPPATSVVIGNQHIPIDDVIPQRIKEAPRRNFEEEILTDEAIQLDRVQGKGVGGVKALDEDRVPVKKRGFVSGTQGNVNIRGKLEDVTPFDAERIDAQGVERFRHSPGFDNEFNQLQESVNNRLNEFAEVAVGKDIPGGLSSKLGNWRDRRDIAIEMEDMTELRRIIDEFDATIELPPAQGLTVAEDTARRGFDKSIAKFKGQAKNRERAFKKKVLAEDKPPTRERTKLEAKDRAAAASAARLRQAQDDIKIQSGEDLRERSFFDESEPDRLVAKDVQQSKLLEELQTRGQREVPKEAGPRPPTLGTKPKLVPLKSKGDVDPNTGRLYPDRKAPPPTEEEKIFNALPAAIRARLIRRTKEPAKVDDKLERQLGDQFRNRPASPPPKTIREEIDEMLARREELKANPPGEKNLTKKQIAALKQAREQLAIVDKNKARLSRKR